MFEIIYGLCNKNQWFTCGTARQYEKMLDFACDIQPDSINLNKDIRKLAVMIWICSDNRFSEAEIFEAIYTAIGKACGFIEDDINE